MGLDLDDPIDAALYHLSAFADPIWLDKTDELFFLKSQELWVKYNRIEKARCRMTILDSLAFLNFGANLTVRSVIPFSHLAKYGDYPYGEREKIIQPLPTVASNEDGEFNCLNSEGGKIVKICQTSDDDGYDPVRIEPWMLPDVERLCYEIAPSQSDVDVFDLNEYQNLFPSDTHSNDCGHCCPKLQEYTLLKIPWPGNCVPFDNAFPFKGLVENLELKPSEHNDFLDEISEEEQSLISSAVYRAKCALWTNEMLFLYPQFLSSLLSKSDPKFTCPPNLEFSVDYMGLINKPVTALDIHLFPCPVYRIDTEEELILHQKLQSPEVKRQWNKVSFDEKPLNTQVNTDVTLREEALQPSNNDNEVKEPADTTGSNTVNPNVKLYDKDDVKENEIGSRKVLPQRNEVSNILSRRHFTTHTDQQQKENRRIKLFNDGNFYRPRSTPHGNQANSHVNMLMNDVSKEPDTDNQYYFVQPGKDSDVPVESYPFKYDQFSCKMSDVKPNNELFPSNRSSSCIICPLQPLQSCIHKTSCSNQFPGTPGYGCQTTNSRFISYPPSYPTSHLILPNTSSYHRPVSQMQFMGQVSHQSPGHVFTNSNGFQQQQNSSMRYTPHLVFNQQYPTQNYTMGITPNFPVRYQNSGSCQRIPNSSNVPRNPLLPTPVVQGYVEPSRIMTSLLGAWPPQSTSVNQNQSSQFQGHRLPNPGHFGQNVSRSSSYLHQVSSKSVNLPPVVVPMDICSDKHFQKLPSNVTEYDDVYRAMSHKSGSIVAIDLAVKGSDSFKMKKRKEEEKKSQPIPVFQRSDGIEELRRKPSKGADHSNLIVLTGRYARKIDSKSDYGDMKISDGSMQEKHTPNKEPIFLLKKQPNCLQNSNNTNGLVSFPAIKFDKGKSPRGTKSVLSREDGAINSDIRNLEELKLVALKTINSNATLVDDDQTPINTPGGSPRRKDGKSKSTDMLDKIIPRNRNETTVDLLVKHSESSSSDSLKKRYDELEKLALEQYASSSSTESVRRKYSELERQAMEEYHRSSESSIETNSDQGNAEGGKKAVEGLTMNWAEISSNDAEGPSDLVSFTNYGKMSADTPEKLTLNQEKFPEGSCHFTSPIVSFTASPNGPLTRCKLLNIKDPGGFKSSLSESGSKMSQRSFSEDCSDLERREKTVCSIAHAFSQKPHCIEPIPSSYKKKSKKARLDDLCNNSKCYISSGIYQFEATSSNPVKTLNASKETLDCGRSRCTHIFNPLYQSDQPTTLKSSKMYSHQIPHKKASQSAYQYANFKKTLERDGKYLESHELTKPETGSDNSCSLQ